MGICSQDFWEFLELKTRGCEASLRVDFWG